MPYIATESRPVYDTVVTELLNSSTAENWKDRATALIFSVTFELYGDANNTRYFKQNEIAGVFCAAALESIRRLGGQFAPSPANHLTNWKEFTISVAKQSATVLAAIPRSDDSQRCGHLNYLITELTLAAVQKGWLEETEGPSRFIFTLADTWYDLVTGPYEDEAIEKNGDTPGYTKLVR